MSTGLLFKSDARERFETITRQRYSAMRTRLKKKGLRIPFTQDQLRTYLLEKFMGGEVDGLIQCSHCLTICLFEDTAIDHSLPLSRGGTAELRNLALPCAACNDRKGEMTADEFNALLSFLERELPFARVGILKRLQQSSKLLANHRRAQALIHGAAPVKKSKAAPPIIQAIDEQF